jgi:hypothetical protein
LTIEFPASAFDKQRRERRRPAGQFFLQHAGETPALPEIQILNRQFLLQSAPVDFILRP